MIAMVPGAYGVPVDIPVLQDRSRMLETMMSDSLIFPEMKKLEGRSLEVRVFWTTAREPTLDQILACPPVSPSSPLLEQVHPLDVVDGSHSKELVTRSSIRTCGGRICVHVIDGRDQEGVFDFLLFVNSFPDSVVHASALPLRASCLSPSTSCNCSMDTRPRSVQMRAPCLQLFRTKCGKHWCER
ncbi:MAG: hypothetical protein EOO65_05335 [Methanosarcinales archaeon]|nr:MAG: hypothetical protein EOO65_05335 [Methanosarcinales archaeon]